ncbi:MAG: class I SAM-dependent methyltransferase [Planctomycetes bacterium]|nr:class I SAM-dependent methyltransferase [Planctomycetota bacterium]
MRIRTLDRKRGLDLRGWFTDEEGAWYAALAAAAGPGWIVEVGCWKGRSASFLAPVLRGGPRRLWCVDHWLGSTDEHGPAYRETLAREPVRDIFRANMAALEIPFRMIEAASVDAARQFPEGSCALVFLDASHDRAAVESDLDAWLPKLAPGGILAGHDYRPGYPGVVSAVDSLARAAGIALHRGPGSTWSLPIPRNE